MLSTVERRRVVDGSCQAKIK